MRLREKIGTKTVIAPRGPWSADNPGRFGCRGDEKGCGTDRQSAHGPGLNMWLALSLVIINAWTSVSAPLAITLQREK